MTAAFRGRNSSDLLRRVVGVALLVVACSSPAGSYAPSSPAGPTPRAPASASPAGTLSARPGDSLYEPAELPPGGALGKVLRAEGLESPNGTLAWGILYVSSGPNGEPVAASGLVLAPDTRAPEPRPIISWAHYSLGLADPCAPSRAGINADFMAVARPFLDAGFVFAATDYTGLGTPGLNPYYVGRSAGADVLLIARAAAELTGAGNELGLIGESQGGHAVLWGAELAPSLASELDLLGTVASSTVADVTALMAGVRHPQSSEVAWVAALQIVWTWHHHLKVPIDGVIDAADSAVAQGFESECPGFTRIPDGPPLLVDLAELPEWKQAMEDNTPGQRSVAAPILMEHGTADPLGDAEALLERLCAVGDSVEFVPVPGEGHLGPLHRPGRLEQIADWLDGRRRGEPAASSC